VFFEGSRYLSVKDYEVEDAAGRVVRVKRVRATPELSGSFIYQVIEGDRLDLLAFRFYRSARKWFLICDANPELMRPHELLTPGQRIVIPPDRTV
jgi:nucleoid-associated protein YgaU